MYYYYTTKSQKTSQYGKENIFGEVASHYSKFLQRYLASQSYDYI